MDQKSPLKKFFKIFSLTVLILFVAAVATFLYWFSRSVHQRTPAANQDRHFVEISEGESVLALSYDLRSKGLTPSVWAFVVEAKVKKEIIEPGIYKIQAGLTVEEVYNLIVSKESKATKVTIPEGYRTEQIAQSLANKGVADYHDFVTAAADSEGKLFPDTYYFVKSDTPKDIVKTMLENFQERTKDLALTDDQLILASITEREAINDPERVLIAGVYMNRLAIGMKLEADPTVQYSKDNAETAGDTVTALQEFRYWRPITTSDYKSANSPYNTYIYEGLPPGPICNPGIASINAAINYGRHDYLYFIQTGGKIYPAKTFKEHQSNIAKYLQ